MIRGFLLLSIGATLYASSEYIPFSKFTENQQIKHNFKKVEINNNQRIDEVKQIKKVSIRNYKKPTSTNIVKKTEIRKSIVQKTTEPKIIQKDLKEKNVVKTRYEHDILYSARLTYSPLTTDYSTSTTDNTNKTNSIQPSGSLTYGNHKVEASYFKSENDFSTSNLDTSWYKLAYKYNYKNINIGAAANHLVVDTNSIEKKETFPSLEIDFKNNSEVIDFEYGASVGKNSNIDYSYEYFFNVNVKPSKNSNQSLVVGYKNRTVQFEKNNEKLEFTGPFIGINTKF